jgi:TRAP-type C4-dicarboxylate transport system permease small subunit
LSDSERRAAEEAAAALDPGQALEQERREEEALPLLFRVLDVFFKSLLVILFCVLIFTVGANVVGRFIFNFSLAWADELSRFLFIWMIFIGAALAHFRDEHIAIGYLVERLPARAVYAVEIVKEVLILLVLAVLLWGAWEVMMAHPGRSALLGVPMNWVRASVPIAAVMIALMSAYRIARGIQLLAKEGR